MTTSSHGQPTLAAPGNKTQPEWEPGDPVEPPEQALLDHAVAGTRLALAGEGAVDDEAMNEWGPERTVRAAVLRHLLVESQMAGAQQGGAAARRAHQWAGSILSRRRSVARCCWRTATSTVPTLLPWPMPPSPGWFCPAAESWAASPPTCLW